MTANCRSTLRRFMCCRALSTVQVKVVMAAQGIRPGHLAPTDRNHTPRSARRTKLEPRAEQFPTTDSLNEIEIALRPQVAFHGALDVADCSVPSLHKQRLHQGGHLIRR